MPKLLQPNIGITVIGNYNIEKPCCWEVSTKDYTWPPELSNRVQPTKPVQAKYNDYEKYHKSYYICLLPLLLHTTMIVTCYNYSTDNLCHQSCHRSTAVVIIIVNAIVAILFLGI